MPFQDNNTASGLPQAGTVQVGVSNFDNDTVIEQGVKLPWSSDPAGSYMYYDCTVAVILDSGIVVHNRLPQVDLEPDTLSSVYLDDPNIAVVTSKGVNLTCRDQYTDIVQRMGHSRYWFRLWGQALRVGYQVPIPAIRTIGGVTAIPYDRNPQWASNRIFPGGNYSGIPLWHAQWSLWYTTIEPPKSNSIPAVDLASHTYGTDPLPALLQAPFSQADDESEDNNQLVKPPQQGTTRG